MDLTHIKRIETTGSADIVNQRIHNGGYLIAAAYKVDHIEYHLGFTDVQHSVSEANQDGIQSVERLEQTPQQQQS